MADREVAFTDNELIGLLQEAQTAPVGDDPYADALRASEIAERLEVGIEAARDLIREGIAEGRVHCVRKRIINIAGQRATVPAYRIKP